MTEYVSTNILCMVWSYAYLKIFITQHYELKEEKKFIHIYYDFFSYETFIQEIE